MRKYLGLSTCVVLLLLGSVRANIDNGTFDTDLSDWDVSPEGTWGESGVVHYPTGQALFKMTDNTDFINGIDLNSTLSQEFDILTGEDILSFDFIMPGTSMGETDIFTASLLSPDTGTPLISCSGEDYFFVFRSNDTGDFSMVDVTGNTISLDVSSFIGESAILVFNLQHDDDGQDTVALIDNVTLHTAVIPAPGALMLAGIGLSCFGFLRRQKAL